MATADQIEARTIPPRSPAQRRIVDAALKLVGEHGVNGTSLQMIADEIGVTKAAVYHQYNTKDAIILEVAQGPMRTLSAVVEAAEAEDDPAAARDLLLGKIIDLTIDRREIITKIHGDPAMARFLDENAEFRALMARLYELLAEGDTSVDARIRSALVTAGLAVAASHSLVSDVEDQELRGVLLELAHDILRDVPGPGAHHQPTR